MGDLPPEPVDVVEMPQDAVAAPPDDALAAQLRDFGPVGLIAVAVALAGNFLFVP